MRDRLTESPLVGSHALELFDMVRRPTGSVPSLTLMDAENIELMTCTMTMLESMQHVAIAAAVLDRTAPGGGEALVEATAALAAAVETGLESAVDLHDVTRRAWRVTGADVEREVMIEIDRQLSIIDGQLAQDMLTRDETYDDDEIDDEMSEEHDNCAERTQRVIDTRVKVGGGRAIASVGAVRGALRGAVPWNDNAWCGRRTMSGSGITAQIMRELKNTEDLPQWATHCLDQYDRLPGSAREKQEIAKGQVIPATQTCDLVQRSVRDYKKLNHVPATEDYVDFYGNLWPAMPEGTWYDSGARAPVDPVAPFSQILHALVAAFPRPREVARALSQLQDMKQGGVPWSAYCFKAAEEVRKSKASPDDRSSIYATIRGASNSNTRNLLGSLTMHEELTKQFDEGLLLTWEAMCAAGDKAEQGLKALCWSRNRHEAYSNDIGDPSWVAVVSAEERAKESIHDQERGGLVAAAGLSPELTTFYKQHVEPLKADVQKMAVRQDTMDTKIDGGFANVMQALAAMTAQMGKLEPLADEKPNSRRGSVGSEGSSLGAVTREGRPIPPGSKWTEGGVAICNRCGKEGHIRRTCPLNTQGKSGAKEGDQEGGEREGKESGLPSPRRVADCDNAQVKVNLGGGEATWVERVTSGRCKVNGEERAAVISHRVTLGQVVNHVVSGGETGGWVVAAAPVLDYTPKVEGWRAPSAEEETDRGEALCLNLCSLCEASSCTGHPDSNSPLIVSPRSNLRGAVAESVHGSVASISPEDDEEAFHGKGGTSWRTVRGRASQRRVEVVPKGIGDDNPYQVLALQMKEGPFKCFIAQWKESEVRRCRAQPVADAAEDRFVRRWVERWRQVNKGERDNKKGVRSGEKGFAAQRRGLSRWYQQLVVRTPYQQANKESQRLWGDWDPLDNPAVSHGYGSRVEYEDARRAERAAKTPAVCDSAEKCFVTRSAASPNGLLKQAEVGSAGRGEEEQARELSEEVVGRDGRGPKVLTRACHVSLISSLDPSAGFSGEAQRGEEFGQDKTKPFIQAAGREVGWGDGRRQDTERTRRKGREGQESIEGQTHTLLAQDDALNSANEWSLPPKERTMSEWWRDRQDDLTQRGVAEGWSEEIASDTEAEREGAGRSESGPVLPRLHHRDSTELGAGEDLATSRGEDLVSQPKRATEEVASHLVSEWVAEVAYWGTAAAVAQRPELARAVRIDATAPREVVESIEEVEGWMLQGEPYVHQGEPCVQLAGHRLGREVGEVEEEMWGEPCWAVRD